MKDSSILEKRVKVTEKKTLEWAQELIDMINEMSVKKQEGKEDELNDLEELFAKKVEAKYDELEKIAETLKPNKEEPFDRTNIPDAGEVLIEKDMIMLKIINEKERDDYLEVSYECSPMKNTFLNEEFKEEIWKSFNKPNAIVTSIYDKTTGLYVGYCSVNNIQKTDWEISIELKKDYQHRGYGFKALNAFIEKLTELTGHRFYKARIDIDNKVSQNLFKKLGAYPDGISEYMLHGNDLLQFQKDNIQFIDDDIRAVAEEFCMEAEDILGYVLEYRIDAVHKR